MKKVLFFILFIFASNSSLWAQISASPTSGCVPLAGVVFASNASATNIVWNFGDGAGANTPNPVHTFGTAGVFHVTYTANLNGSPIQYSIDISVFGKPIPGFTAANPHNGCVGFGLAFKDTSKATGGSSIVKWKWSFGDGGVNTSSSAPLYYFNLPGTFNVSLEVTDANGCLNTVTYPSYVTTSIPPVPIIISNPANLNVCAPPLNVTYNGATSTSNSPLGSTLTYKWFFGNGDSAKIANPPAAIYTQAGSFVVSLTVTDKNSCSATATKIINILAPKAIFTVKDTVCLNVNFVNNSTGGGSIWYYGDGTTGFNDNHTYASGGKYTVKLLVSSGNCKDSLKKTIFVETVKASFTTAPHYSCSKPFLINFTNTSSPNAVKWKWYFGNGDSSKIKNPSLSITSTDTNRYKINREEIFIHMLIAITSHGCRDIAYSTVPDTLHLPTAMFMPDKQNGCLPLTVTFSDSSRSKEHIVNYQWDFGDGSTHSGADSVYKHTYLNPGSYYASLIITNAKGCIDTSYQIRIDVGDKPSPVFSATPTTACHDAPIQFTDLTPAKDSLDTWHYSTDNQLMSGCQQTPNPSWGYYSNVGKMDVTLTGGFNGCYGSTVLSDYITVLGPIVRMKQTCSCDSPFVRHFSANLMGATSWTWDFGDGVSYNTTKDTLVRHVYVKSGDYHATLTGFNNVTGCLPFVDNTEIMIRDIKASFTRDSLSCSTAAVNFDAGKSQDVYKYCNKGFQWDYGDGSPPFCDENPGTTHVYPKGGGYNAKLIVRDVNGCKDTLTNHINIFDLQASFIADTLIGCLPLTVKFTNFSVADTGIKKYSWSFGDGGISSAVNPTHVFNTFGPNGTYNVVLTVTDSLNCVKTYSETVNLIEPDAGFLSPGPLNFCAGVKDSIQFIPNNQTCTSYTWTFGDGKGSSSINPYHPYIKGGDYNVLLQIIDTNGCKAKHTEVSYVHVQDYPIAAFSTPFDNLAYLCHPVHLDFTDKSVVNIFGSRTWDLDKGQSAYVADPVVGETYGKGVYTISLIEQTTFGCADTATRTYTVVGPEGNFTISDTLICLGDVIHFDIKDTSEVFTYKWDFGDGSDTTALSPVYHQYNFHPASNHTTVQLILYSTDSTCAFAIPKQVYIRDVLAQFNRNYETTGLASVLDSIHCLGTPDLILNTSKNATSWQWSFGDGSVFAGGNPPAHTYSASGTYDIKLMVSDFATGCKDTIDKKILINPLPVAVAVGGDTCGKPGTFVLLNAQGGVKYEWSPASNLSNPKIPNPKASPSVNTTYTVTVTDANGCVNYASALVTIYQKPPEVHWDTTIVIGEEVKLDVAMGAGYTYLWKPSDGLSCNDCPNPKAEPHVDMNYSLDISDNIGCFTTTSTYDFIIKPVTSIDVPQAFTPNNDHVNDLIFVRGWGIKKLLEFKIFNRFGQIVFETSDIETGWDGYFNGELQNMETYTYIARVETWVNNGVLSKQGSFNLLR